MIDFPLKSQAFFSCLVNFCFPYSFLVVFLIFGTCIAFNTKYMFKKLINKFTFYTSITLFANCYILRCEHFPLTKALDKIPEDCKQLHKFLCKKVLTGSSGQRNRFACAFVIKTSTNQQKTIYVDQIEKQTFKAEQNYYANLAKKETMGEGMESPIVSAAGRINQGKKTINLTVNISQNIFENGAFVNADQIPLYCLEQENIEIKKLVKNVQASSFPMTLMQRLFFSQVSLFCERESKNALYRCYNSDSELHALYVLGKMCESIASKIKGSLAEDEKITAIEFHGCTTRDMCPLCYTNMNCMQFLANEKGSVGLLGALLARLKCMGYADDSTSSATFISSLEEFPPEGNNLWNIEEIAPVIGPGFVYQFRFTKPETTAIKDSSEESLKTTANIIDLSSL